MGASGPNVIEIRLCSGVSYSNGRLLEDGKFRVKLQYAELLCIEWTPSWR